MTQSINLKTIFLILFIIKLPFTIALDSLKKNLGTEQAVEQTFSFFNTLNPAQEFYNKPKIINISFTSLPNMFTINHIKIGYLISTFYLTTSIHLMKYSEFNEINQPQIKPLTAKNSLIDFSLSTKINNKITLGLKTGYFISKLAQFETTGIFYDIGTIFQTKNFTISLGANNLLTKINLKEKDEIISPSINELISYQLPLFFHDQGFTFFNLELGMKHLDIKNWRFNSGFRTLSYFPEKKTKISLYVNISSREFDFNDKQLSFGITIELKKIILSLMIQNVMNFSYISHSSISFYF